LWLFEQLDIHANKGIWRVHDVLNAFTDEFCEVRHPHYARRILLTQVRELWMANILARVPAKEIMPVLREKTRIPVDNVEEGSEAIWAEGTRRYICSHHQRYNLSLLLSRY